MHDDSLKLVSQFHIKCSLFFLFCQCQDHMKIINFPLLENMEKHICGIIPVKCCICIWFNIQWQCMCIFYVPSFVSCFLIFLRNKSSNIIGPLILGCYSKLMKFLLLHTTKPTNPSCHFLSHLRL